LELAAEVEAPRAQCWLTRTSKIFKVIQARSAGTNPTVGEMKGSICPGQPKHEHAHFVAHEKWVIVCKMEDLLLRRKNILFLHEVNILL
jgi:hypothetical protein